MFADFPHLSDTGTAAEESPPFLTKSEPFLTEKCVYCLENITGDIERALAREEGRQGKNEYSKEDQAIADGTAGSFCLDSDSYGLCGKCCRRQDRYI